MNFSVKEKLGYYKTLALISVFSVLFGLLGAVCGEIFVAATAALLACVFSFENKGRRIFSFIVPVLLVVISALVDGITSLLGAEAVIVALVIYLCATRGYRKSVCAAILTAIFVGITLLSLVIYAFKSSGQISFSAVVDFYTALYENTREQFVDRMSDTFAQLKEIYSSSAPNMNITLPTSDEIGALFDAFVDSLISILVIIGFLLSGIALRVFGSVSSAVSEDPITIIDWRFGMSSLFAYFYIALYVAVWFVSGDGAVALTVTNLYSIFMIVFAYLGFRFAYAMLRIRLSGAVSWIIMIAAILFLSGAAIQILSVIGAFVSISNNRVNTEPNRFGGSE